MKREAESRVSEKRLEKIFRRFFWRGFSIFDLFLPPRGSWSVLHPVSVAAGLSLLVL